MARYEVKNRDTDERENFRGEAKAVARAKEIEAAGGAAVVLMHEKSGTWESTTAIYPEVGPTYGRHQ